MAVIGVPMLLGPIFGPILGGWLVDNVSWRWIFFINMPIAVGRADRCRARILPRDVPEHDERLDWLGLVLLSPGLALLIYGLAKSGSAGGFGEAKVLVPDARRRDRSWPPSCGTAAHARDALIDLRLFKNRTFRVSSITLVARRSSPCSAACCCCRSTSRPSAASPAMDTGLLLAPQGFGAMITMPIAGRLTDQHRRRAHRARRPRSSSRCRSSRSPSSRRTRPTGRFGVRPVRHGPRAWARR